MVVAAAGNVDHATVVRLVRKAFGAAGDARRRRRPRRRRAAAGRPDHAPAACASCTATTEQANLVLGGARRGRAPTSAGSPSACSTPRSAAACRSRLFQEVREKRGLAYSVYCYHAQYADTGLFGVYAGCVPRKVDEVLAICRDELAEGRRDTASPSRSSSAARASCAARWSSASRTPARG